MTIFKTETVTIKHEDNTPSYNMGNKALSNSTRHNINVRLYGIKNLLSDQEGYHKNKQPTA